MSMRLSERDGLVGMPEHSDIFVCTENNGTLECVVEVENVDEYYWRMLSSFMYDLKGDLCEILLVVVEDGNEREIGFQLTFADYIRNEKLVKLKCVRKTPSNNDKKSLKNLCTSDFQLRFVSTGYFESTLAICL